MKEYVSKGGTVLVRVWDDGKIEVFTRPRTTDVWDRPVRVYEERSL